MHRRYRQLIRDGVTLPPARAVALPTRNTSAEPIRRSSAERRAPLLRRDASPHAPARTSPILTASPPRVVMGATGSLDHGVTPHRYAASFAPVSASFAPAPIRLSTAIRGYALTHGTRNALTHGTRNASAHSPRSAEPQSRAASSVLGATAQRTLVTSLLGLPQLSVPGLGGELVRTLLGGMLGGLGRRIFGGSGGAERGATAAQPVYTQDVGVSALLTELLAATRALQLRGMGRGLDELSSELALQRMRAGAEVLHA